MAKIKYYAVKEGRQPGVYNSWGECEAQVSGYPGAEYKGFGDLGEARKWLETTGLIGDSQKPERGKTSGHRGARLQRAENSSTDKKNRPGSLNPEQQKAFEIMLEGENVFLTGEAGTGKSYLLQFFLDHVGKKNVIVCAPTGIAALQIGGATIHSTFRIGFGPLPPGKPVGKVRDVIREADVIIIDEISMCRFDLFDYVCRYILQAQQMSKRKKQVIVVGDFYQLPPVMKREERDILAEAWQDSVETLRAGYAFLAPGWKVMQFHPIVLREVMRQKGDSDFMHNLNRIRMGDKNAIAWFHTHTAEEPQQGIFMYGTNKCVDDKNFREINLLHTPQKTYLGEQEGVIRDLPTSMELTLCEGARVMSVLNDVAGRYQNGSLGTVIRMKEDSVVVRFDNGTVVDVEPYTWEAVDYHIVVDETTGERKVEQEVVGEFTQLPLKIAFAITIHKSQGQTYDSVNLDPACFGEGQLYVALSRVRSAKTLYLTREIRGKDLITSKEVKEFYEREEQKYDR